VVLPFDASFDLNFGHLRYFHAVAETGGLTAAAEALGVQLSTVSAQVHALERELGLDLFARRGRSLVLTDTGERLHRHTTRVFSVADDLVHAMRQERDAPRLRRVVVGVYEGIPELEARRVLGPLFDAALGVYPVVRSAGGPALLATLVAGQVDLVVSDDRPSMTGDRRLRSRVLDACPVALVASPEVAASLRGDLAGGLASVPLVLPGQGSRLRSQTEGWLRKQGIRPHLLAEIADSGLLYAVARDRGAVAPMPASVVHDAESMYGLRRVDELDGTSLRYQVSAVAGSEHEEVLRALVEGQATRSSREG
jgi:LysR family transcriptional activator of nhaA